MSDPQEESKVVDVISEWQLKKLFDTHKGVILDVWAPGCGPCE